jgi:hypothetical protein
LLHKPKFYSPLRDTLLHVFINYCFSLVNLSFINHIFRPPPNEPKMEQMVFSFSCNIEGCQGWDKNSTLCAGNCWLWAPTRAQDRYPFVRRACPNYSPVPLQLNLDPHTLAHPRPSISWPASLHRIIFSRWVKNTGRWHAVTECFEFALWWSAQSGEKNMKKVYHWQHTEDSSQSSASLNKESKGLLLGKLTHIHTGKTWAHFWACSVRGHIFKKNDQWECL